MNPDQTASKEQSDLGPYCLQYWLPKIYADTQELKGSTLAQW